MGIDISLTTDGSSGESRPKRRQPGSRASGFRSKPLWTTIAIDVGAWLFVDTARRHAEHAPTVETIRCALRVGYEDHILCPKSVAAIRNRERPFRIGQEWLPLWFGLLAKIDQQLIAGAAPDMLMFQDEPFPLPNALNISR